ncbi:uncharacterized protein Z519_02573 [Cladophialophora bantiana CBS 173.52]|uniref:Suppressor protein SRP40 n=1 Tax=Cladophialophora bantiana (strain ATCC 10958 / CBS 173.52 / CDC B-1940 / NIH 8579) TaxID=1442370 RepID=A0A0D2F4M7_CLAB1|nr:uncharacterized protein Z519_02573 [Cladophialophora bantiana CBS 173.52]KIW97181.1 hypothetical protein Z519_02573 [Cladophialophora bantiana CBS 173.52]
MVSDLTRLHVTPLDPDLLQVVVGPHLLELVANLSYHTIQTSPENNYGYFDLPAMEADKLKKKLNGAILKGRKIKVEEARPKKRRLVEDVSTEDPPIAEAKRTKTKKSKDRNVIQGYELPADRRVKRGWTEPWSTKSGKKTKSKAVSSSSKYTDKAEALFRTKVPPNKLDGVDAGKKEKVKSKKKSTHHVVHEFEKSTMQPSFLKQDIGPGVKGNLRYVEGKGWVDEEGQVVEKENERVSQRCERVKLRAQLDRTIAKWPRPPSEQPTSSSAEDTGEAEVDSNSQKVKKNDEASSSNSSSNSESEEETTMSASPHGNSEANSQPELHPLEALFKKPKTAASQDIAKPSLEISTSFSFFDSGNPEDLADEPSIPLTPFSSQDIRYRGLRSAAPTPDTAHPSRFNSYGSSGLPGDEPEGDGEEGEGEAGLGANSVLQEKADERTSRPQSDFEKKFWENRAENNRSWKLRRRTVLKEKRQRENKARRPKNW